MTKSSRNSRRTSSPSNGGSKRGGQRKSEKEARSGSGAKGESAGRSKTPPDRGPSRHSRTRSQAGAASAGRRESSEGSQLRSQRESNAFRSRSTQPSKTAGKGSFAGARGTPSPRSSIRSQYPSYLLTKALERVIAHGHPWVYRDAVAPVESSDSKEHGNSGYPSGAVVDLFDQRGRFLARGLAEEGALALRIWLRGTSARQQALDEELFVTRVEQALDLRANLDLGDTNCIRCINGEGDRIPGLVCDRYGDTVVAKLDTDSLLAWNPQIFAQLWQSLQKRGVKCLAQLSGRGPTRTLQSLYGELPNAPFAVTERGMKLVVDLHKGQKTGLFLDHRPQRWLVRRLCEAWKREHKAPLRVLNLYGYTGGFSLAAGLGGADEVVTVDLSAGALSMAQMSWEANALEASRHRIVCGKAEDYLASPPSPEHPGHFDIIVADPPSFAPNQKSLKKALGAYKAMHRACLSKVVQGGYYITASCSSHVSREAFEESLREGAHAAGVELQVLGRGQAGADHPVPLGFPQGNYLCATWCRVLDKGRKS